VAERHGGLYARKCDDWFRDHRDIGLQLDTVLETNMGDPQQNETQSLPEWMTVAELAAVLRLNRKTVYGWIAAGEISDRDGVFVVRGRYLMHWPTFRAQQFKPRERLRGQLPEER
jgi:hypothetical protein